MKLDYFPEDVIKQNNLQEKAMKDGIQYIEVRKGMDGLPQSRILAQ